MISVKNLVASARQSVLGLYLNASGKVVPKPISFAASASNVHAPASATAASITYAAAAATRHVIGGIAYSYAGGTPTGNLKVEDGSGNVVFSQDISGITQGAIHFFRPLAGTPNTALIVTLSSGGSGVTGKISILGKGTE